MELAPAPLPRRRYQYRLRTLMIVVTLAAMLLGAYQLYRKLTEPPFITFWHGWETLHNGDTLARVQEVLGPGQPSPEALWIVASIQEMPQSYPEGLEPSDTFFLYTIPHREGCCVEIYVQIRQGRLVNHHPKSIQRSRYVKAPSSPPKTQP